MYLVTSYNLPCERYLINSGSSAKFSLTFSTKLHLGTNYDRQERNLEGAWRLLIKQVGGLGPCALDEARVSPAGPDYCVALRNHGTIVLSIS